ncbi:hypothetical protein O9992_26230 [Vibrio lentus]|nr:hypothetical protein [Vibrio lentus]
MIIPPGKRDKVKRITVNADKLSLQMHHHRAEHWVVVAGTAKVTNDEKTYLVEEDQSTYIPLESHPQPREPWRLTSRNDRSTNR